MKKIFLFEGKAPLHNKVGSRNQEVLEPGTSMDNVDQKGRQISMDYFEEMWTRPYYSICLPFALSE